MGEFFIVNEQLSLGQQVRILRIARHWTQDNLASKSCVTQGQVSALERDLPVYPSAKNRILKILGLDSESEIEEADYEYQ